MPTAFDSYEEFDRFETLMVENDAIDDRGELWYDVRPHSGHGTVEVRAPDGQTDPETVAAFVEYTHALVVDYAERFEDSADPEPPVAVGAADGPAALRREVLDENQVARDPARARRVVRPPRRQRQRRPRRGGRAGVRPPRRVRYPKRSGGANLAHSVNVGYSQNPGKRRSTSRSCCRPTGPRGEGFYPAVACVPIETTHVRGRKREHRRGGPVRTGPIRGRRKSAPSRVSTRASSTSCRGSWTRRRAPASSSTSGNTPEHQRGSRRRHGALPSTVREALAELAGEDVVDRRKRQSEGAGNNPYEYTAIPPSDLVGGVAGRVQDELNTVFNLDAHLGNGDNTDADAEPVNIEVEDRESA